MINLSDISWREQVTIDCQILDWNRWTDNVWSKFEGKIWSCKHLYL